MNSNTIFQYIRALYENSRNGKLTLDQNEEPCDYPVEWDEETAEALARQCSVLIVHIAELASQYDKLLHGTWHLNREQKEVWDTYLLPFPEHGLEEDALRGIWEKEAIGLLPTKEERALSRQYDLWYEENALTRLPWKGCAPTNLICRAQRYARLVQVNAPAVVQENEVRCLAEEFVLYHCLKR